MASSDNGEPPSLWQQLFDSAPIAAVVLADAEGRIGRLNQAAVDLLRRPAEALRQMTLTELAVDADRARIAEIAATSRHGHSHLDEVALVRGDGSVVDVEIHARPVLSEQGLIVIQLVDRQTQRERMEELRALAEIDELTGLFNRRGFSAAAEQLLRIARRQERDVSFMFIDVEGLKAINDELGHTAGDEALRQAADILRDAFRDADAIGRFGGDEFCVLALTRSSASGDALRQRLEEAVTAAAGPGGFRLRLTVGLAHRPAVEVASLATLITDADRDMYGKRRNPQHDVGH